MYMYRICMPMYDNRGINMEKKLSSVDVEKKVLKTVNTCRARFSRYGRPPALITRINEFERFPVELNLENMKPSEREALEIFKSKFGPIRIREMVHCSNIDAYGARNIYEDNMTPNIHDSKIYVTFNFSKPGSNWVNWSVCKLLPKKKKNCCQITPKLEEGVKVAISNTYRRIYDIEQGIIVAKKTWDDLVEDEDQWFRLNGNQGIKIEKWFYRLEGIKKWWPGSCLADIYDKTVKTENFFYLTVNGLANRKDEKFSFVKWSIPRIVDFCKNDFVRETGTREDNFPMEMIRVFEGVAHGIVESFITVRAFNDGAGFELEHSQMLPTVRRIVTPEYWGITFFIDKGEYKIKFTLEYEKGKICINTYSDVVGFLNIPTIGSKIDRFYFGKLLQNKNLDPNYMHVFQVSIMEDIDHIALQKMKNKYSISKVVEFRPVTDLTMTNLQLYRKHGRAVRKLRKNITGINYCLENLSNFSNLQECIDSVSFIKPWWKKRLTFIVMKRTGLYEALRLYQTLISIGLLDVDTVKGLAIKLIHPGCRCKTLINEFARKTNLLKK